MRCLTLIGLKYAGKSTLARYISTHFGKPYVDMDDLMLAYCAEFKKEKYNTIYECYKVLGERQFRKLEAQVVLDMPQNRDMIISSSGGVVLQPAVMSRIKRISTCVYLAINYNTFKERSKDQINAIVHHQSKQYYQRRRHLCEHYADVTIHAEKEMTDSANEILRLQENGK